MQRANPKGRLRLLGGEDEDDELEEDEEDEDERRSRSRRGGDMTMLKLEICLNASHCSIQHEARAK